MSKHFSGVFSEVLRDKYYINKIYKSSLQTYNSATCLFGGLAEWITAHAWDTSSKE